MFAVFRDSKGAIIEPYWKSIEPRALALGDLSLHRTVQGQDLFAKEAHYHPSCRNAFDLRYVTYLRDTRRAEQRSGTEESRRNEVYEQAFDTVLRFIQQSVVEQKNVVTLKTLRDIYIKELDKGGFPCPDYRAEKLKARIEKNEIIELINFAKVVPDDEGCRSYNLVFSAKTSVWEAVSLAYQLGSTDKNQGVALFLRNSIQQAFKQCKPLPWPPSVNDLETDEKVIPSELVKFLNYVVSGESAIQSEKKKRIILSIGQVC